MELKAICGVSVGHLGLEIGRQVDDGNRIERTFLGTNTTSNTQTFGNECYLRVGVDFYA